MLKWNKKEKYIFIARHFSYIPKGNKKRINRSAFF